jgi:hypothetical protein
LILYLDASQSVQGTRAGSSATWGLQAAAAATTNQPGSSGCVWNPGALDQRPRGGDTSEGVVPRAPHDAWRSLFVPATGSRRWRARPGAAHVPTPLVSLASYSHSALSSRLCFVVAPTWRRSLIHCSSPSPGKFSCHMHNLFNLLSMRSKLEISTACRSTS